MKPTTKSYIELHVAVLLFGFTAILGKLIELSAVMIVWWRVLITSVSLLFLIRFGKALLKIPLKYIIIYSGIGVLVGLHWITFYGSIKLSNASITLVCMATTSFFTSFLEPAILKKKINKIEIILGLAVIPAMFLIANTVDISMHNGIWLGLLSALLASMFACYNKKYITKADSYSITFLELSSAWLFISLLLPVFFHYEPQAIFVPTRNVDWIYILIMALLCTTLAYILALLALRHVSAFASNLVINLEPVYGILLAAILLNEHEELSPNFYIGVIIILSIVLAYPIISKISSGPANQKQEN